MGVVVGDADTVGLLVGAADTVGMEEMVGVKGRPVLVPSGGPTGGLVALVVGAGDGMGDVVGEAETVGVVVGEAEAVGAGEMVGAPVGAGVVGH